MKLKALLFIFCFSLISSVFADNRHYHPQANQPAANASAQDTANAARPGYCEVEVLNLSGTDLRVSGIFDDGSALTPFYIDRYDRAPHYISLVYYGSCHRYMRLFVDTASGYNVFSGTVERDQRVTVYPFLNKAKAEVSHK